MAEPALALEGGAPVLGRYRPLRLLGSGGSGSVWLARDERTGLDVALKIIAREGKAAARAEREAAAAARLRHPACLRAYAFARDARHVYIAYEFVPGRTFREAMRAGELCDAVAIEACAQVCDALAHAHAAGILHRDVKPSNVLLADGERVSARLLDFGLARMAEAETLTEQGDVPGTLAYISPERLAGEEANEAADVWAVGVMLWEALAGQHPFWQGSMLDTARAIERGAPPLAELRPDLPKGLLRLVDRALALDPSRRPSAAELARGLRGAATPRRRKRGRSVRVGVVVPREASRAGAAGLAAAFAGWTAAELPFYPHGWAAGLALGAAALTLVRERLGLAVALAVPVLPLGNVSSGLALLYALVALAWLALCWREPRSGLLFALGSLLAPVGALGLFPLATAGVRAPVRRAAQAALAVLAAMVVAGIRHAPLPLTGAPAPLGVGVGGATGPLDVAGSLARAAAAQSGLLVEAAALGLVALALPYARAWGRWGGAGLGALMLALTLLPVPAASALQLVAAAWITAAAVALAPPWPRARSGS
ncbi:MAG: serine/threonine protein kinase [Thermoleophilia bacterium]|nr:serine/threonine protein kinase [Thermoleophilia bacterium]